MDTKTLVQNGYKLKMQIAELTDQLHEIHRQIAEVADYKDGSQTGHINTPELKVTVSQRENVKWNSEKLMSIKNYYGDKFNDLVKVEYKPEQRKIKATGGEIEKAFKWAKEVTLGTPSVTYKLIIEEQEAA